MSVRDAGVDGDELPAVEAQRDRLDGERAHVQADRVALAAEQRRGLLVHVRVLPVLVESDDGVADPLEDDGQGFHGRIHVSSDEKVKAKPRRTPPPIPGHDPSKPGKW